MTEYHFDASNSISHNFNSTNKNQQQQQSNASNQSSSTANANTNVQSKHNEPTGTTIPAVVPYNEEFIHKVQDI